MLPKLPHHRHRGGSAKTKSPPPPTKLDSEEQTTITKIYCDGICCPMEIPVVESALGRIPGVKNVEVAVVTKTVTVQHSTIAPAVLVAALNEARLSASLTFPREQSTQKRSWLPPWHILIATLLLLISLFHYLSGPVNAPWLDYFKYIALAPVAICLPGIVLKALGALRHFVFDIHFLIAIAAAGAIALGDYTEAGTVVVLFAIADFLEGRCTGQARDAITAVLALKPATAILAATGQEIDAASVKPGSLILVRSGDKAPLDGIVVSGSSTFDESILTGESVAVVKHAGDQISAGTLNSGSGAVQVETTTTSDETFIAGMVRLVEQATSRQSPSETAVARFAKIYTPIVLVACLLLAFVPWSDPNADRRYWVYLSLQVLVTSCPCALVLSTPVTVVSAIARAAQVGVLIKGGIILETLKDVQVVTLDKTGTLTAGAFLVQDVKLSSSSSSFNEDSKVLRLLGSLERGSSHPLAAAIVGRAAARGISCDAVVESSSTIPGSGIEGIVDGHSIRAGTVEFLKELSSSLASKDLLLADAEKYQNKGLSTCFIAIDGTYTACITAKDSLRPEAVEAIAALRALHVTPAVLTGDNSSVAMAIGTAAGIDPIHIHAGLLPQGKLDLVSHYNMKSTSTDEKMKILKTLLWILSFGLIDKRPKQHIKVAHVGDGVNDAPALAAADVGIAMGVAGAAAALEAGDVALFTNDLRVIPALQRLAFAANRKIVVNIAFSVVTKIAVLVLAALGKFTLFGAVLVDVGSALLVTLNGLTLLRYDFGLGDAKVVCIGATVATSSCCGTEACSGPSCASSVKKEKESSSCCGGHTKALAASGCCNSGGSEHNKKSSCCSSSSSSSKSATDHHHRHSNEELQTACHEAAEHGHHHHHHHDHDHHKEEENEEE